MLNFDADLYLGIARNIAKLESIAQEKGPQWVLPRADIQTFDELLKDVSGYCNELGLVESSKLAIRSIDRITQEKIMGAVSEETRHLYDLIKSETKAHSFFYVPPKDEAYYAPIQPLFGILVANKFPGAAADIAEAGRCFALDRHTASVLHLMRALESGLERLSKAMKVPYRESSWNDILGKLEGKWKKIEARQRKPKRWKSDRQFYSEAFIEFRHFKDAWRNYAMHARSTYSPEGAEIIFIHVRSFMQHLAKRFSEV